jgi:hypothetical protein
VIEFALVSVFLVPLLLGTVNVGMNLSRSIQGTQVSRDAGHMYARQVDFSIPANQDLIVRLAGGLNMTRTGGDGVVILTKVMMIGAAECLAGGLAVAQCPNYNQAVIINRIVVGNASMRQSSLGTPPGNLLGSNGDIEMADYLTNSATVAQNFSQILVLQAGEYAFVAESYFSSPEWSFPGSWDNTSVYARTMF